MKKYWGLKAIVKNNIIVDITTTPEVFTQVGEMLEGCKVYEDANGKSYFRQKIYGKFIFIPM